MDMDFTAGFGKAPTIDAYAKIQYGGCKMKTKTYTQENEEVVWMQEMLFPIEVPIKAPTIQIQIWDEDKLSDELCCSLDIPITEVLKYNRK